MVKEYLIQLFQKMGLKEKPQETTNNSFIFTLSDNLVIELHEQSGSTYFQSKIAEVPSLDREELFIKLLQSNFLQRGMGESVIGMDANEKSLTLSANFPYEMDYATFIDKLETFVNCTDYWQHELKKWQEQKAAARHKG